jgi:Tfp pilus assembly protein PilN
VSSPILNLARSPFLNRRLVERFCLVLWVLGVVLIALNVSSYLRNRSDSTDLRSRLRAMDHEIAAVGEDVAGLQATIRELGPEEQNSRVLYLNQQIAERTFPWGELFDELGEILPRGVRLRNLLPESLRRGSRVARDAGDGAQRSVALSITGIAKTEAAIYELVDALFAHPHFSAPDLKRDRRQDSGDYSFVLSVGYRGSNPGGGAS